MRKIKVREARCSYCRAYLELDWLVDLIKSGWTMLYLLRDRKLVVLCPSHKVALETEQWKRIHEAESQEVEA